MQWTKPLTCGYFYCTALVLNISKHVLGGEVFMSHFYFGTDTYFYYILYE